MEIFLSVIVCTYNRQKYIGPLLESIAANTLSYKKYELIVVDNNCTDGTKNVCEAFEKNYPELNFRYVLETEQGLSAARNKGIRESRGDLFVYVDDDALVDYNYLSDYVQWFEAHPKTMAAGGPIHPSYESGSEPEWMTSYTKALLTGWLDYGDKVRKFPTGRYPGGGNAAYRKCVFDKVGLFNTKLGRNGGNLMGSEEKDIFDKMAKLDMEILYLPTTVLHHLIPPAKLGKAYFDRLTLQIGQSERQRTLSISKSKYLIRLWKEFIKWCGTLALLCIYTVQGHPNKGWKLILFRKNVTKGLILHQ